MDQGTNGKGYVKPIDHHMRIESKNVSLVLITALRKSGIRGGECRRPNPEKCLHSSSFSESLEIFRPSQPK